MKDIKNYLSLNKYARERFGKKLYKISLAGGESCPNRDGICGERGCIFCSEGGSGDFATDGSLDINAQIDQAKQRIAAKMPKGDFGYIAYFQSFTGTYGNLERLSAKWRAAMSDSEVEVLAIATRPDCLGDDVMAELENLNRIKPVWIELGLQTIHERTASYIRRGYTLDVFEDAVRRLKAIGIEVIVHVILGLPGETSDDMLETVAYVSELGVQGIKLQLLHVLKGTDLADEYLAGKVGIMEMDEYFDLLVECLKVIPENMAIHRLTGDGPKKLLIAPLWTADKKNVLNKLNKRLLNI